MKPVFIFCMALVCLSMVLSAPAPAPLGFVAVPASSVGTLAIASPSVGSAAAFLGLTKLGLATVLALQAQDWKKGKKLSIWKLTPFLQNCILGWVHCYLECYWSSASNVENQIKNLKLFLLMKYSKDIFKTIFVLNHSPQNERHSSSSMSHLHKTSRRNFFCLRWILPSSKSKTDQIFDHFKFLLPKCPN